MIKRYVLFYWKEEFKLGYPNPFRYMAWGTVMPQGCVVCGMGTRDGDMLVIPDGCTPAQQENFHETVRIARWWLEIPE